MCKKVTHAIVTHAIVQCCMQGEPGRARRSEGRTSCAGWSHPPNINSLNDGCLEILKL